MLLCGCCVDEGCCCVGIAELWYGESDGSEERKRRDSGGGKTGYVYWWSVGGRSRLESVYSDDDVSHIILSCWSPSVGCWRADQSAACPDLQPQTRPPGLELEQGTNNGLANRNSMCRFRPSLSLTIQTPPSALRSLSHSTCICKQASSRIHRLDYCALPVRDPDSPQPYGLPMLLCNKLIITAIITHHSS